MFRKANKFSNRPDLHAFVLLDKLVPGTTDIIEASKHDEFFLSISIEQLAEIITEDQVIELIRCGIRFNSEYDCLCMFA